MVWIYIGVDICWGIWAICLFLVECISGNSLNFCEWYRIHINHVVGLMKDSNVEFSVFIAGGDWRAMITFAHFASCWFSRYSDVVNYSVRGFFLISKKFKVGEIGFLHQVYLWMYLAKNVNLGLTGSIVWLFTTTDMPVYQTTPADVTID